MIRINEGINHYINLNEIMQDGIEHNASLRNYHKATWNRA